MLLPRTAIGLRGMVSLGVLMVALGLPGRSRAEETVTLQLKWRHQFQFAGYYAAEAKGFYKEEGLSVRIIEGGPGRPPVPTVLNGGADFGVSDSEIVLARAKGQPVVACAAIFQHSPYVIMSLKQRGIRSPGDLPGKRVMLGEDQGAAQFRGMLIREGVAPERVEMVPHSWEPADLIEGRVDAMSAYAMVEPVRLKARGIETSLLRAIDYGVDFYGDTLFTTEAHVRSNPKRVAAFVRASLRGWDYAMKHPEEIADLIAPMEGVAERGDTREVILQHAHGMRDFILPDVVEIGHMNPGRWERIADTFAKVGMAPANVSLTGFVFEPNPPVDPALIRRLVALGAGCFVIAGVAIFCVVMVRRQVRLRTQDLQAEIAQRQRAEDELKRQQRFLTDLVENSGSLVFAKDREGRYQLVNKMWEAVTGRPRGQVLGRTDADVFPGPSGERFRQNDLAIMEAGRSQTIEELLPEPAGVRTFLSVKFPLRDASGAVAGVCGMTTDITERIRTEEARRRSDERFAVLFQSSPVPAAFSVLESGRLLEVNARMCEFCGWTREEVIGKSVLELGVWCDPDARQRMVEDLRADDKVHEMEVRLRHRSGEERPVLLSMKRLELPGVDEPAAVALFIDISEQHAAQQRQAHLLRTIRTISEANSLIVRAKSEEQLLNDFCERMVKETGHRLIWVGFVDDKTRRVQIVAKAGSALEYLEGIELSADENEITGRGPSGVCIRTGQTTNCRSFTRNSDFAPWLERAERAGMRSSISLALRVDGRVIGAFTIYSDVEDRFDDEESDLLAGLADDLSFAIGAMRRERWLRIISHAIEHSPATVVITDSEGNIEYVNPKFTELTGYTKEEAIGENPRILKSGETSPEEYRRLWETIKAGGEWRGEFHNVKKNGELYWENAWVSPVPDESSGVTRFIAIKEDITARMEAERLLRDQLARTALLNQIVRIIGTRTDLQTILFVVACNLEEHLPVDFSALCLIDEKSTDLMLTAMGKQSEQLAAAAGFGEGERLAIVSDALEQCKRGVLVHEPELVHAQGAFGAALARAGLGSAVLAPLAMTEDVFGVLLAARRQPHGFSEDDREFVRQLGEHVGLAIHQVRLLSDLRIANAELHASREAALQQERLRALGQMASGVAHDINNAISPVSIYCDLIQQTETNLNDESKDFLKTIQHAIQDVAGTVARLREFYRKRDEQIELFPIALNHVAKEVVKLTRARWVDMPQERGIVIQMDLQLANALPDVPGIETEIREAVINLVFNAVDAMPEGGRLTLRTGLTEEKPPRVFIEVGDTGVGMDAETRHRCLEPFFTTKGEHGTGLGLAMVCGVAQRHDAEIIIESERGKGTTIRLTFTVPDGALLKRAPADEPVQVPPLRVLVVDDDPLITRALDFGLQVGGHTVVVASGGKEGIERFLAALAEGPPFQAVITDLGMPHVDGRQVAAAVKAAAPATPVILLTGWGQRLIAADEIPENVDRVLSKPPRLREVAEALAACCGPALGA